MMLNMGMERRNSYKSFFCNTDWTVPLCECCNNSLRFNFSSRAMEQNTNVFNIYLQDRE